MYGKYNIHSVICHLIPPEASGWFRKEIKTLDDLKGLKMRFFGLGANVMQNLGVSTQLLQAGEIFQALQLGTIDATEFSMPVMDLSLGFHQVAKFYYFPGWHQQATFGDLIINKAKWDSLSPTQKAQVEAACDQTVLKGISVGEAVQSKAMKEIESKGVKLMTWPPRIPRGLREGMEGGCRRAGRQEPGVQEGLGLAQHLPQGIRDLEGSRLPEVAHDERGRRRRRAPERAGLAFGRSGALQLPADAAEALYGDACRAQGIDRPCSGSRICSAGCSSRWSR